MRNHPVHHEKIQILAVFFAVLAMYGIVIWTKFLWPDLTASAAPTVVMMLPSSPDSAGIPARIRIASIRLDASIEDVSVAPDRSMAVPKDPMDAGWYMPGPRPGDVGSAVIDGHVNWYHGQTGVFANLRLVKPGDVIVIHDDKGTDVPFVVRDIRTFDAKSDARDIFRSSDGKAHLNLITCDGVWDKKTRQYTQRLVVFADRSE